LELVKRVLMDSRGVDVFDAYQPAIDQLRTNGVYDAVLCGLDDPARTIECFEAALNRTADTRLILIASDETQVVDFCELWNADPKRKKRSSSIGKEWLRERCTAGEILALFKTPPPELGQAEEAGAGENETPVPPLQSGCVLDGYQLVCPIGKGGFGSTWLVINQTTGKQASMKFVQGEEQTRQELAALRKYVHVANRSAHLIQVEHINQDQLRLWFVTPLADSITGGYTPDAYKPLSLQNQLEAKGHIVEKDAVGIAAGLVRALATLHETGLLHGDCTPPNILSMQGRWVLADPGLVRFIGQPEICRNKSYYPQSPVVRPCDDLYAVVVVVWEMVSGVSEMVSNKEVLRLDGKMLTFIARKNFPTANFLCRAAAENPRQRYMTADAMLQDLELLAAKLAAESGSKFPLYELLTPFRTG
jgi:hypothetical protein